MSDTTVLIHSCSFFPFSVGVESEVSLVHPNDISWFLTVNETHHKLSSEGNKRGSTELRWCNPSFPHSGNRVVATQNHATGVYAYNLAGESLPPLYIFETKSKIPENFKIDPEVCEGLPVVSGKFGHDALRSYTSEVDVWKKGSMDTILWSAYNRQCVIRPYHGEISPVPVRDPMTKKLVTVTGIFILEIDAGRGRLSKEAERIEFHESSAAEGEYILLSLLNGT